MPRKEGNSPLLWGETSRILRTLAHSLGDKRVGQVTLAREG